METYLQLWSLKDETAKDFFCTLKKVSEMGFAGVEFAGFGGIQASEMKAKLEKLNLKAISAHVGYETLKNDLDQVIEYLKTVGAQYIICPGAELKTVEQAKARALEFNEIGKKCKEQGLRFGYHNHAFELNKDSGQLPLEVLFENVNPNYVIQQPDVFWLEYGGIDAISYLEKHKDRIPIIHLKQIRGKENVNAQDGTIDFKRIREICKDAVFVYEQEEYPNGTPLECVEASASYLVNI